MSTLRVDNIKSRTGTVVTIPDSHTLAVTGVSSISGNQTVGGTQTVSGDQFVSGVGTVTGSQTVGGTQTVSGWQTVSGSQIVSGNTNITGIGTVGGTLNVTGDLNVSGGGSVVATTGVGTFGTLNVTGTTTYNTIVGDLVRTTIGSATTIHGAGIDAGRVGVITAQAINVDDISGNTTANGNFTIKGNLDVQGTQTTLNSVTLDVEDKTIGIGSTSNASSTTADGGGIVVYGSTNGTADKTLLWQKENQAFEFNQATKQKGVYESVGAATTLTASNGDLVVEMDVSQGTTWTYNVPNGHNIGIVSFKNVPANTQTGTTVTLITTQGTQGTAGWGNTTFTNGIGVTCSVLPYADGAVAGISTRARIRGGAGSASTVTLSTNAGDVDFLSFFVHYNGGTNTDLTSYKVYVTKNGGFTHDSIVGI